MARKSPASQPLSATLARRELARLLRKARAHAAIARRGPRAPWQVELSLIGSAAMTRLNRRYRGKGYATDVLSFPTPEPFRSTGLLGELVICLPTLRRQAREQGHPDRHELQVLLAHGVLHLLGLDHEEGEKQAREMARLEAKLLGAARSGLIHRAR